MAEKTDKNQLTGKQSRSKQTQDALMSAAEKLIAERGIAQVSIRDIVQQAGQKNESALQYHFKNLQGLITAIQTSRSLQIQEKRAMLLAELLGKTTQPTLRQMCDIMVRPTFLIAKSKPDFRKYIIAFGHELTLTDDSALRHANRKGAGGASGAQAAELLRVALPHLDEAAYQRRMDSAIRFVSASMTHHARQKNAFKGPQADLFYSSILDALEGLLSAPVSSQTKQLSDQLKSV